jgi:hypothetical protein
MFSCKGVEYILSYCTYPSPFVSVPWFNSDVVFYGILSRCHVVAGLKPLILDFYRHHCVGLA